MSYLSTHMIDSSESPAVLLTVQQIIAAAVVAVGDGADGVGISSVAIDGSNHLIVTLTDSTTVDAGEVPTGADGADGTNGTNGTNGTDGADGTDGVGISSVAIDGSNHLIVTLTDSTTVDAGELPTASGEWTATGDDLLTTDRVVVPGTYDRAALPDEIGMITDDGLPFWIDEHGDALPMTGSDSDEYYSSSSCCNGLPQLLGVTTESHPPDILGSYQSGDVLVLLNFFLDDPVPTLAGTGFTDTGHIEPLSIYQLGIKTCDGTESASDTLSLPAGFNVLLALRGVNDSYTVAVGGQGSIQLEVDNYTGTDALELPLLNYALKHPAIVLAVLADEGSPALGVENKPDNWEALINTDADSYRVSIWHRANLHYEATPAAQGVHIDPKWGIPASAGSVDKFATTMAIGYDHNVT